MDSMNTYYYVYTCSAAGHISNHGVYISHSQADAAKFRIKDNFLHVWIQKIIVNA